MLRLDLNLVLTIINLIVLYLLMKHFLIGPVKAVMDKRQALIEEQMSGAKAAEDRAEELKDEYEEKIWTAHQEEDKILAGAKTRAKAEYDRILAEAGEKAGKMIADAQKTAKAEEERMLREAESQIAVLVMAAAAKVIGEGSDEKQNRLLYDQFLAKAGDSNDTNLG